MKTRIINTQGISSADLATGNLLWVDAVNGVDALAARGRMTIPFKTLTAAKLAASPQGSDYETIIVMPGTYDEKNLLKNKVNWHFLPGAKVVYTGSGNGAIFDTSSNGTNGAVDCMVTGHGIFEHNGTAASLRRIVYSSASGSNLIIQGRSFSAINDAINMADSTGSLRVDVIESIFSDISAALIVSSASRCVVKAYELQSDGDYAIGITAGNADIHAHRISSSANSAIAVQGGTGTITINAYEIYSTALGATIKYNAAYNPILAIYNARIKNDLNTSAGRAISITSGGSNYVRLSNCTLVVKSAADYSIGATSNTNVHFIGDTVANEVKSSTVAEIGSALINNGSIS